MIKIKLTKQNQFALYPWAMVLTQEMNCYGYRKGNWKITKFIKVKAV